MKAIKIEEPKVCPYCGSPVERKLEDGAHLYCSNPNCNEVIIAKLNYFVSKGCMDIEGLSEKTLRKIVSTTNVKSWKDLYLLTEDQLRMVCNLGPKTSKKIIEELEKSKAQVPAYRVLVSMGIPFIGQVISKTLLNEYKSLDFIQKICTAPQAKISGDFFHLEDLIGFVAASNLFDWFVNSNEIYDIYDLGLQHVVNDDKSSTNTTNKLDGLIILATGTLKNFTREGIKESVIENGGIYASGVNKKLNYLIVGSEPGESKLKKAEELGIKQISEDEYLNLIK